jgi:large subunit ribosomal protein L29
MKLDEIRGLNDADARARLLELREEQFRLRFRSATEPLESPLRLREVRRDIARVLTIMREKELAAERTGSTKGAAKKGAKSTRAAAKTASKSTAKTATKTASTRAAKTARTKSAR